MEFAKKETGEHGFSGRLVRKTNGNFAVSAKENGRSFRRLARSVTVHNTL